MADVTPPRVEVKISKFLALRAAGFTSRDIIEAHKAGTLADLLALVQEDDTLPPS